MFQKLYDFVVDVFPNWFCLVGAMGLGLNLGLFIDNVVTEYYGLLLINSVGIAGAAYLIHGAWNDGRPSSWKER